jgi:hypothetical protein
LASQKYTMQATSSCYHQWPKMAFVLEVMDIENGQVRVLLACCEVWDLRLPIAVDDGAVQTEP